MRDFDRELPLFIGEKKKDVYLKKFEELGDGYIGWNWCAFLFSGMWMLYRKMYLWFSALLGISFVIALVFSGLMENAYVNMAFSVAIWICAGMFGDKLYYIQAKKKFEKSESYEAFIRKGGTNLLAPIVFGVIVMFLSVVN